MWYTHYEVPTEALNQLGNRLTELQGELSLLLAELADAERQQSDIHPAPIASYLNNAYWSLGSCATALNHVLDHRDRSRDCEDDRQVGEPQDRPTADVVHFT
jgi:hypothetical protein